MNKGLSGSLRLLAILSVLVLAALAILFVLDVIPREQFADAASKVFSLLGIAAVTVLAIGVLFKSNH